MKKILLGSLGLLLAGSLSADLPADWYNQLQRLAAAATQFNSALQGDSVYYAGINAKVDEAEVVFRSMNDEREQILSCIRSKFANMKLELQQCHVDTENYVNQAQEEIVYLRSQLEGLRERTTAEINQLKSEKSALETQINDLETEIVTDTAEFREGATDLLNDLKHTMEYYNDAIASRDSFIDSVNELISMLDQDISSDTTKLVDLKKEICV